MFILEEAVHFWVWTEQRLSDVQKAHRGHKQRIARLTEARIEEEHDPCDCEAAQGGRHPLYVCRRSRSGAGDIIIYIKFLGEHFDQQFPEYKKGIRFVNVGHHEVRFEHLHHELLAGLIRVEEWILVGSFVDRIDAHLPHSDYRFETHHPITQRQPQNSQCAISEWRVPQSSGLLNLPHVAPRVNDAHDEGTEQPNWAQHGEEPKQLVVIQARLFLPIPVFFFCSIPASSIENDRTVR